jgi:dimethylglycine dehydrogenase
MVEHTRVVIIGGGAVGVSSLYHLAKAGWKDCVLLEQNELTSGSTWHAAGNCPTFSTTWGLLKLQKYSAELYRKLGDEVGYPINYHVVGAVRLAHTRERMDEFRHVRSMARANGMEYEVLAPEEIRARHPFVTLDDLAGALWDPYDGDIDPAQLTQALAKGARDLGATIRRFTRVKALAQLSDGRWRVTTNTSEHMIADVVVNAAGYRAGEIMAMIGRALPLVTMSHQYLVTEDVPELVARTERLPLLRDPDVSYYLRQERSGFLLGPYEWGATPMWADPIPEDFSFKLWNDDLERLETYIEAALARVPPLASVGVRRVVNGPIPYSPDGNPYIGPEQGLRNFFHANTFSFGITQAGGAGKALAEWVIHGGPEWDLWPLDRRRYTAYADVAYTKAKAVEVYQNEYAPAYPNEERQAGRPRRTSSLYARLKAKGASFGARGGWERAVYFGSDALSMKAAYARPMTRALRRSRFPRPYIWRLTSFSLQIWPSVCPLDQDNAIAASIAALSLDTPLPKAATRLLRALMIQVSSSASAFRRMMSWNSRMISRASTRTATPLSIAATVIVSAFDSRSRPTVRRRATVRADGARANAAGSAFSAFFRRALHSLTTRRQPRNPCSRSARHRAAPLRHPASHCSSSQGR